MSRMQIYDSGSHGSNYGSIEAEPLIYSPSPLLYRGHSPAELRSIHNYGLSQEVDYADYERQAGDNDLDRGPTSYHHRHGNGDAEKGGVDDNMGGQITLSAQVKDGCRSCCTPQTFLNKFPILKWIPNYRGDTFIADMVAGMTVGLTVIPQGLAYAQIANLPFQYGLYSAFMGCFIYCLMGTSKDITLGPTAIMSLMTATFGTSPIQGDATFAIVLTLISGLVQLSMGLLKLGILVSYISYPVINAFTSAAAITIAFGQVKNILGLKDIDRHFLNMVYETCEKIPETKIWDMVMGIVSLVAVILLKKLRLIKWADENDPDASPSIPILIIRKTLWLFGTGANAIIIITAAGLVAILDSQGITDAVSTTGHIKGGMPPFDFPKFSVSSANTTISASELFSTIGSGLAIVPLLGLVETMAIGKAFARANNYKIDPTQELLAIGVANVVSSFVSSYPITGSFSRTAVNSQSGVRTPMGGVWTGGLVILALCVLTPWFKYIPKSALAAVIIAAVIQMVDYHIIRKLWRSNKWDLLPWSITFVMSLAIGIEYGILIGIGVSLFMLLYPIARPKLKFSYYSGAILMTPMQGMNFPAAEYLELKAMEHAQMSEKARSIIINLEHVTDLDYTAAQSLKSLQAECVRKGIKLVLVHAQPHIREQIKNADIKDVTCVMMVKDALDDLNINDGQVLGPEEEEPFMNQI